MVNVASAGSVPRHGVPTSVDGLDGHDLVHASTALGEDRRQGTPIPLNDVWIAALVLQHHATLFTRDSDFERLPQLPRV
ncbi:MAG: PIN domain-containing protein [Myxococcota bacterium]|jgi:predicted nucleic acid-binding protein